jgi:transposase
MKRIFPMVCRRKSKTLFVDSADFPLTSGAGARAFEVTCQTMIQGSKPEPRIMRYELTDHDWSAIKPMLPNKVRGVPRVNDRRVRKAGVWSRVMEALAAAHDPAVQMIDTSIVRVHQHGACITRNRRQSMGRSRGGLTSKIHAVVDTGYQCDSR